MPSSHKLSARPSNVQSPSTLPNSSDNLGKNEASQPPSYPNETFKMFPVRCASTGKPLDDPLEEPFASVPAQRSRPVHRLERLLEAGQLPNEELPNPTANVIATLYRKKYGIPISKINFNGGIPLAVKRLQRAAEHLLPDEVLAVLTAKPGHEDHALSILFIKDSLGKLTCLLVDSLGTDYSGYAQESIAVALQEAFGRNLYGMPTTQYSATGCITNAMHPIQLLRFPNFKEDLQAAMRHYDQRHPNSRTKVLNFDDLRFCPDLLLPMQGRSPVTWANEIRLKYGTHAGQTLSQAWQGSTTSNRNTYATDMDKTYELARLIATRPDTSIPPESDPTLLQQLDEESHETAVARIRQTVQRFPWLQGLQGTATDEARQRPSHAHSSWASCSMS